MLKAGMELEKMCLAAKGTMNVSPEQREKGLRLIASYIDVFCAKISRFRSGPCSTMREGAVFGCGRHYGNYFISCKVFIRFLYLVNSIGQLFFLNEFLGSKFYVYGYEVIYAFFSGADWSATSRFPRQTLCDIDLRQMNNVHRWTFQCVLPMNLFNEKFFIFLWFWYLLLSVLNALNVFATIGMASVPFHHDSFVIKYLKIAGIYDENHLQKTRMKSFIKGHLQQDGVFILKQISDNASTVIVQNLIRKMWILFLKRYDRTDAKKENRTRKSHRKEKDKVHDFMTAMPLLERNGILKQIAEDEKAKDQNNVYGYMI